MFALSLTIYKSLKIEVKIKEEKSVIYAIRLEIFDFI